MKKTTIITLAMLLLIATLANAQTLNLAKFSGNNGGNGFIRSQDNLNLEIHAEVPGDTEITIEQIIFDDGSKKPLTGSCSRITGNLFNCTSTIKNIDAGDYRLDLFRDDYKHNYLTNSPEKSISFNLTVDDIPPELAALNTTPIITKDGRVKIFYHAKDYLKFITQGNILVGDTSTCSGIKNIDFKINNTLIASKTFTGCDSKLASFDFQYTPTTDFEEIKIEAKATDFTGHSTQTKTSTFYVDNKKPFFQGFKILDRNNFELTHLKTNDQRNATIVLNILGDQVQGQTDVDPSSIIVDLSKLNPAFSKQNIVKIDDTTYTSDFIIANPADCEISIEAKDIAGNELKETQKCTLPTDNKKPIIKSIKTLKQDSKGNFLLGINTSIIAELEDLDDTGNPGIGFAGKNIFLNLAQLGLGTIKADSCTKNNAYWECTWKTTPRNTGKKTISIDSSSSDDLGNNVENKLSLDVIIDKDPPTIHNHLLNVVHETGRNLGKTVISGDEIIYSLNVSDVDTAYANFSAIGGEIVRGNCYQNKTMMCDFLSNVFATGPYEVNITFDLFDISGNKANYNTKLFVYGLQDDPNPNFWKSSASCTPEFVSTSLAKIQNFPVYCHVKLTPLAQGVETGSIKADCTPTAGYVKDVDLVNAHQGSTDPYLIVNLHKNRESWNNTINFDCDLDITSKKSGKFFSSSEEEKVNIEINFKDIKDPYTITKEETNKAVEEADNFLDELKDVERWLRSAEEVCSIKQTFTNAIGVLYLVTQQLDIVKKGVQSIPILGTGPAVAAETMRQTSCYSTESARTAYSESFSYLDQYCMFANCQLDSGKDSWGVAKVTGGGAPWCSNVEDYLSKIDIFGGGSSNALNFAEGYKKGIGDPNPRLQALNVKDSLVLSTACFCLPGIVQNLNEFREVKCRYATCLMKDVKEKGITKSDCDNEKDYFECTHLIGEIWNTIPFSQFYDQIADMIAELLSNPVRLVDTTIGYYCVTQCPDQGNLYYACAGEKVVATISEAISSFNEIKKRKSWIQAPGPQNFCEEFEDAKRTYKK